MPVSFKQPSVEIEILEVRDSYSSLELLSLLKEIRLFWQDFRQNRVTEESTIEFTKKVKFYREKVTEVTGITTAGDFEGLVVNNPHGYISAMGNAVVALTTLDRILASFVDPIAPVKYDYGWEYKIITATTEK